MLYYSPRGVVLGHFVDSLFVTAVRAAKTFCRFIRREIHNSTMQANVYASMGSITGSLVVLMRVFCPWRLLNWRMCVEETDGKIEPHAVIEPQCCNRTPTPVPFWVHGTIEPHEGSNTGFTVLVLWTSILYILTYCRNLIADKKYAAITWKIPPLLFNKSSQWFWKNWA